MTHDESSGHRGQQRRPLLEPVRVVQRPRAHDFQAHKEHSNRVADPKENQAVIDGVVFDSEQRGEAAALERELLRPAHRGEVMLGLISRHCALDPRLVEARIVCELSSEQPRPEVNSLAS
ncbi:hypothetical protein ACFSF0_16195 [Ottowia flava]|uniref:Uncharacterized protein n=1 Tax=Ottowia flava TaxID=2675430 RepID=A0ABW4KYB3_9BURK|nr:hypothetical protein [Ottowia sp. GY511]